MYHAQCNIEQIFRSVLNMNGVPLYDNFRNYNFISYDISLYTCLKGKLTLQSQLSRQHRPAFTNTAGIF